MRTKSLLTGKEISNILVEDAFNTLKNHGNEYIQEAIWILKAAKYANNAKLSDAGDIVLAVSNLQDYITDKVYTQLISYDKCQ